MTRVGKCILGAAAAGATVWLAYLGLDPAALGDAQTVLLFIPALCAGALAGEALPFVFTRSAEERAAAPGTLIRNGVVTLGVVALFVWLGSTGVRDMPRRVTSPWCLIPAMIGVSQVGMGLGMRRRP